MQSEGSISDDGSVSDDSESDNASEGSYSSEEDMEGNLIVQCAIFFFILHLHLLLNVTFSSSPKTSSFSIFVDCTHHAVPFKIAACLVQDAHSPKHGLACAYILADITKSCRRMKKRNVVSS